MARIHRRAVLALLAASGVTAGVAARLPPTGNRVARWAGIQLYMLEAACIADLPGTLRALSAIGYREVEMSGLYGRTPGRMRAILDRCGLVCPSMHLSLEKSFYGGADMADPDSAIELLRVIGARRAVVPTYPFFARLRRRPEFAATGGDLAQLGPVLVEVHRSITAREWREFAGRLNQIGARLAAAGMRLGYHNHDFEFAPLEGGETAFSILAAETDPRFVDFELDVGWVAAAGHDPLALLRSVGRRVTQVHLKDVARVGVDCAGRMQPADLGRGIIDWPALFRLLPETAVEHLYVEQEPPFAEAPLGAARKAFAFLVAQSLTRVKTA